MCGEDRADQVKKLTEDMTPLLIFTVRLFITMGHFAAISFVRQVQRTLLASVRVGNFPQTDVVRSEKH